MNLWHQSMAIISKMNKHEVNEDALTNIMILLQEAAMRGHLDVHLEYLKIVAEHCAMENWITGKGSSGTDPFSADTLFQIKLSPYSVNISVIYKVRKHPSTFHIYWELASYKPYWFLVIFQEREEEGCRQNKADESCVIFGFYKRSLPFITTFNPPEKFSPLLQDRFNLRRHKLKILIPSFTNLHLRLNYKYLMCLNNIFYCYYLIYLGIYSDFFFISLKRVLHF